MSEVNSHPDQSTSEPFATPELFRDYLTGDELSDLIDPELFEVNYGHLNPDQQPATLGDIIQLAEDEEFYAECLYLNHWCAELDHDPEEYGIEADYRPLSSNGQTIDGAEIYIAYHGEHEIFFQYRLDPVLPGYQLQIIDSEGNVVYWRKPGQDPYTEWTINCMADDPYYVNADGEIAFTGDHTNI